MSELATRVLQGVGVTVGLGLTWYWGIRLANTNTGKNGNSLFSTAEGVTEGQNLQGKVMLVTGAASGIGTETARVLALRGAHVIVHARSLKGAEDAIKDLQKAVPQGKFTPVAFDLGDTKSIKSGVEAFLRANPSLPLHALILNAGVMALPTRRETVDGFEMQMGVNHLGHFLLTHLLLPTLLKTAPARVVVLSSSGHRLVNKAFVDDPKLETPYADFTAYGNSKMANVMFARELNARYKSKGLTAVSVHPGGIASTGLSRHMSKAGIFALVLFFTRFPAFKTVAGGAATTCYCASSPEIDKENLGGEYFCDGHVSKLLAPHLDDFANNAEARGKLWATSEKLLGIKY